MKYQNYFRKYGGERIPNIIDYINEQINKKPNVTISVGCDSLEKTRGVVYVTTIMFYDNKIKNGAHVIFNREKTNQKMDTFNRLYKESEIIHDLAEYIEENIDYKRNDLDDYEIKKYKFHLEQHKGKYMNLEPHRELEIINSIQITNKDRFITYKLCDVHLDYNVQHGDGHYKSHNVFKAAAPWFKSNNYRVWCKPYSHASTSAADALSK
jgi:predicted RNase H-related nuclease YkuK (DUF458 family)